MLNRKSSNVLAATIRRVLIGLLLYGGLPGAYGQTTYYVASTGSDANNGRSANAPFQTIDKVNSLVLQPGDNVLFRRGDTFRGTVQIRQSGNAGNPIIIDAYGSGNKPVLAGSVPVTNWTSLGNNTWQADCPSCGSRVTGLYLNNSILPLGRYPNLNAANKGYLTIQSHAGKSQITSQQGLPANFTGGEVVIRPVQWILNRATITQQSGNTLSISYDSGYEPANNWGYFIQNHPATLDQNGEWYYNAGSKKIQLYSDQNPNGQSITATAYGEGVSLSNVNYVTVRNVQITQTLNTGLAVTNSSNLVFSGVEITRSGEDGVVIAGSGNNVLMENGLIEDVNNNGFTIQTYQNFTFRGNIVRRIGLVPGQGKSGDGTYTGFQSACTANTLIENNVVDNIGYNAVNFSNSTVLQRNIISNYCLTKSDGGGLYIWNGNKQPMNGIRISSNVVYNGIGSPEGTPGGTYSGANGIYLDDCTTNIEVTDNSVFNCRGLGIYLHGSSNVRVTGNTVYNNGEGQLAITDIPGACSPRDNIVLNNVLVSRTADQFVNKYESHQNDLSSYGQFDNNVYARPSSDAQKIFIVYNNGSGIVGESISLANWQSRYGKDPNSKNSPATFTASQNPDDNIKLVYNTTGNPVQTSVSGPFQDVRTGTVYNGQVSIPAFSSMVLVKQTGQTPTAPLRDPENPANTVAGLDYGYYEGNWSTLPNFDALTAQKSGSVGNVDLSVRNRDSQYAIRYKGYISVPADGQYTFYITSDDGSKLLIGSTEVVNNDGLHGEQERTGTIGLKAGKHAITISFLQGGGGQALTTSYSGPGLTKQAIPASAYFRVGTEPQTPATPGTGSGLRAEYFNNISLTAPVVLTRTDAAVNFDFSTNSPASGVINTDNFSARWSGQVQAPVTGNYTFSTTSDDGVRLWVNGNQVISNWTSHGPTTDNSASIALTANQKYDIRMEYYEGSGGATARLLWTYAGQGQQVIPQDRLYPATAPTSNTGTAPTGNAVYLSDLTWASMTNGYGPAENDRSNGEAGSTDGRTLKLNGVTYAKGVGTHAASEITYSVGGRYSTFITDMGIDDEIGDGSCGSIEFQVYVDNALVYSSGTMTPITATKSISLNVSGKQTLKLVVSSLGDACGDHGDWAGARLIPSTTGSGSGTGTYLSDLTWTSMNNGYGPVEKDRSNGEAGATDGRPLKLNGVTYAKGLGTHANSEITYNLEGRYNTFITDVGIDDEISDGACGSLEFQVYLDNVLAYSSGTMTPTSATKSVNLNVSGKQTLRLVVSALGDACGDHGDWAGARLTSVSGGRVGAIDESGASEFVQVNVYPIPAGDEVRIRYPAKAAGEVIVQLINAAAVPVAETIHQATEGENLIKVAVSALPRGLYVLTLTQGHQRISRKVILAD
ncbi:NPCBM/NEW2 domain-containing protein [Spirosoma fluminis]